MRSPSHTPARAGGTAAPRPTRGPVDPRITVALAPALGHTVEWQTTEYQHVGHREVSRAADRVAAELRKAVGT